MPGPSKEEMERFRKGELGLAQVLGMNAEQIAALLLTGHALFENGRLEQAKNIFEGLAVLDGRNAYVHGVLGAIHQKLENYDVAVERYSLALNLQPEDVNSLVNRGEIYLKMGHFSEAAADFKKAIDLDQDQKHPAANRARLLVTVTQEALQVAKEKGLEAVLEAKKQLKEQVTSGS